MLFNLSLAFANPANGAKRNLAVNVTRCWRDSPNLRNTEFSRRPSISSSHINRELFSGTHLSIASEGVEARKSATKSETNISDSWPIADIIGTGLAIIARATASRLNVHKSSGEPPPRAIIIKSTIGRCNFFAISGLHISLAVAKAWQISVAELSP